uniref:AlNc14C477G11871 protein n=1 Tax=Albugo laibachii Nc14 TaxID=890382 RepID=F0X0D2_9STRA|nr:AlNc14C477G11871 [Albugo laibachii Nc14]|eukprot:CCA27217.1 AlNc14C477G11871 [Albugo laibachii Nc14]
MVGGVEHFEHVMNSMLMTSIPSMNGIELMTSKKVPIKTCPDNFQFLLLRWINEAVTYTTLLELHQRLVHLAYGNIERMAGLA